MIFTLPANFAQSLPDPLTVLKYYDQLIELYHQLRGSDINLHRLRFSPNIQLLDGAGATCGLTDTGYIIESGLDDEGGFVRFFDYNNYISQLRLLVSKDFDMVWPIWGIFHEIGKITFKQ